MLSLTYVSDATRPATQSDLDEILFQSRKFNTQHGLTGLLVYAGGSFLQVVEGEPGDIENVMTRVRASTRHINIRESPAVPQQQRRFPDWAMGFQHCLDADVVHAIISPLIACGAITRQTAQAVLMARFTARTGLGADSPLLAEHSHRPH